jgi:hypothetical protein
MTPWTLTACVRAADTVKQLQLPVLNADRSSKVFFQIFFGGIFYFFFRKKRTSNVQFTIEI